MKYLTLLFILFFVGCDSTNEPLIITSKYYTLNDGTPLPNNICHYFYKKGSYGSRIAFQDSCWKYNIGDTIKIGMSKRIINE